MMTKKWERDMIEGYEGDIRRGEEEVEGMRIPPFPFYLLSFISSISFLFQYSFIFLDSIVFLFHFIQIIFVFSDSLIYIRNGLSSKPNVYNWKSAFKAYQYHHIMTYEVFLLSKCKN